MIGYLHRCHEKLAETLTYVQYPTIASKTDYVAAMTSELAYVMAAEEIGKFEVPKRAQYLRVLVAELQRIASHCLWLGTWCMDMGGALGGGATIFLYCIRERELVLDLFEALVGARLLYGFHQVGGVRYDMPEGWTAQCRETIDLIEQRIDEYEQMLEDNPFFLDAHEGRRRRSRASWRRTSASAGRCCAARASTTTCAATRRIRPTRISSSACRSKPAATASRATSVRMVEFREVDHDHPPGARRAARGPDLVASRRQVGRAGAGAEGRGLRARRRVRAAKSAATSSRTAAQAVPHEVARRVVLEPGDPAAHHSGP